MHDFIGEQVSKAIAQAMYDLLEQAQTLEPIITADSFPLQEPYTRYIEYGLPPKEKEDEANVVEGSIVQPVTDEGRLLG